jgi:hypothetical protein
MAVHALHFVRSIMRIRVTISDAGGEALVFQHSVNTPADLTAGVRLAIREFQRSNPNVALGDLKVALETLAAGNAQMWL